MAFEFSAAEAEELVTRLAAARDVIEAKHASFTEKPEAESRAMFTLLQRKMKEDNEKARWFATKLEGHRKLTRHEQYAVNQICKAECIKT